jgi:hypothetical protein
MVTPHSEQNLDLVGGCRPGYFRPSATTRWHAARIAARVRARCQRCSPPRRARRVDPDVLLDYHNDSTRSLQLDDSRSALTDEREYEDCLGSSCPRTLRNPTRSPGTTPSPGTSSAAASPPVSRPEPARGGGAHLAVSIANLFDMTLLYGCAGRLTPQNGGF